MEAAATVEAFVKIVSNVLLSSPRLKSLCNVALHRTSRSMVLHCLIGSLGTLSRTIRKQAKSQLEKTTAWMLLGCKTAVALSVCDSISPEEFHLDKLLRDIDQQLVSNQLAREKHLGEFMVGRFPGVDQHSTIFLSESHNTASNVQPEFPPDEVYADSDLPNTDVLSRLNVVEKIVSSPSALQNMYDALKTSLFKAPSKLIHEVLQADMPKGYQTQSVLLLVDWQILEFCQAEDISPDEFDNILTMSGELEAAEVAHLKHYVSSLWPTGVGTLAAVKHAVHSNLTKAIATHKPRQSEPSRAEYQDKIDMQLFTATSTAKEQAYIKLTGTFDQIEEKIEQLAWITATLRPRCEGGLTVSEIDFRSAFVVISDGAGQSTTQTIFRLSLFSKDKSLQPESTEFGQCWTSICAASVLARGWPLSKNHRPPDAVGLDVPFQIMAAFAGVRYPLLVKDRIVFAGDSNILVAETNVDEAAVQWHFQQAGNWIDYVSARSKKWDPKTGTSSLANLTSARAYLGYFKNAEVLLGTAEFEHIDPSESNVPRSSMVSLDTTESPLHVTIDEKGNLKLADGTIWKLSHGEATLLRTRNLNPSKRLWDTARRTVLLYDQETSVASLVSELSVVLQLVSVYLRHHSTIKRTMIPVAKVAAQSGEAAYEAIAQAKEMLIPLAKEPSRRYIDIVEDFLDILEQRRTQTYLRKKFEGPMSSSYLRGWDHADLQAQKFDLFERQLIPLNTLSQPLWWDLLDNSETLVLFTRMGKIPIRNTNNENGSFICRAWDDIPTGKHVLITTIDQLEHFRADHSHNPRHFPSRYMLSNTLAWARPVKSALFGHTCASGGSCNPLQALIMPAISVPGSTTNEKSGPKHTEDFLQHPGKLEPNGAVMFVNDPSSFEHRQCWARSRPKRPIRADQNYLFVGASFAAFILIYWNFWFFVLSVLLLSAVYVLK